MKTNFKPAREEIEQRARELWQARGQPYGRDDEIWLEAERELMAGSASQSVVAAGRSKLAGRADDAPKSLEEEADPIENNSLEERLSTFGDPASRSATSL